MIGNYILNAQGVVDKIRVSNLDSLDLFDPIQLNNRIIEHACGFEYDTECCWNKGGIKLWYDGTGYYHINSETMQHIDHLHQLQNWYRWTANEPLEINENKL